MKKFKLRKKIILLIIVLILGVVLYFLLSPKVVIDPVTETWRMNQLEHIKETSKLSPFKSDGCSGNISEIWSTTIQNMPETFSSFEAKRIHEKIPFEDACIKHDKLYHIGNGGYEGRLKADNQLRNDILLYGIENADTIVETTNIQTREEVIFIYEIISEVMYRGVRIGGSPCTGESYAWGFGYNNNNECNEN